MIRKISNFQSSNSFFSKIMISDSYYAYRNRKCFDENRTFTVIHIAFARVPQIHRTKTNENKADKCLLIFCLLFCVFYTECDTRRRIRYCRSSVRARRISRTQCEQFIITTLFSARRSRGRCVFINKPVGKKDSKH